MSAFSSVVVIGIGLIGGSFARAVRELDDAPRVIGIDTDAPALAWAVDNGVIDPPSYQKFVALVYAIRKALFA